MLTKIAAFDPETVSLLGAVLDQAIALLPSDDRSQERKTLLASKLLSAASTGKETPSVCGKRHLRWPLRDAINTISVWMRSWGAYRR